MTRRYAIYIACLAAGILLVLSAAGLRRRGLIRLAAGRDGTGADPAARLIVPEIAAAVRGGHPVIFVGLDAADWGLLDQYIAGGVMPNLARLVAEGASGRVQTLDPPLSPLVWTTMMTGTSPLEHRILDFVQFDPVTGQKEPIESNERRTPAVWNMASVAGRSAALFGLWATYPAEAVNGVVVSDRLFTFLFKEQAPPAGVVFPATREAWGRDALLRADRSADYRAVRGYLPWLSEQEYGRVADSDDPYGHPVSALRRILIQTAVYRDLSLEWIRNERPDLTITYFEGTDTIGHVFAPYAPPRQPSVDASEYERYHDVPARYFHEVDAMLGDYMKAADERGAVVMVASDHGFFWGEGRPTKLSSVATASAARWHAPEGIYVVRGPGIQRTSGHAGHGSVEQVAATLIALMGLPPGRDVNGDPLPGAPPPGATHHADYGSHYRPAAAAPRDPKRPDVDPQSVANLRALGYIGAGESASAPPGSRGSTRTPGSYNNEGILLKAQRKLPQAMVAFEKALSLDPNHASAEWNLSDVMYARGQDLDRSDDLLMRAFAGGLPEGEKFLIGRAIAYQRNGQLPRSLKLIDGALAAKPRDSELWLFRGRYRVEGGDCRGASLDFERAIALAPGNPTTHSSLGLARLCLGDRTGARAEFDRSLKLDPAQPTVREYLQRTLSPH